MFWYWWVESYGDDDDVNNDFDCNNGDACGDNDDANVIVVFVDIMTMMNLFIVILF